MPVVGQSQRKNPEFINESENAYRGPGKIFSKAPAVDIQVQAYRQFLTPDTGGVAVFQGQWVNAARMLRSVPCSQLSQSAVVISFGTDCTQSIDGKSFLSPM